MKIYGNWGNGINGQRAKPIVSPTLIGLMVLGIIGTLSSYLNWLQMDTFFMDDGRWLLESWRVAIGEIPYRDFSLQYPPLANLLLGYAFRFLGSTFVTAQIVVDALSIAVVLLTWLLARKVLPESVALAVASILALQGATPSLGANQLSLFTLTVYTPSVLTGVAGILLLLLGMLAYIQAGALTPARILAIALGALISLLSKPEFMLGVAASLVSLALADRGITFRAKPLNDWLSRHALMATISVGPAVVAYLALSRLTGMDNLLAGVTGYGVAAGACPWWPTGLGLVGGVIALGWGTTIIVLFSIPYFITMHKRYGWRYGLVWIIAAVGAGGFIAYHYFLLPKPGSRLAFILTPVNLSVAVLHPVLWFSVLLFVIQSRCIVATLFRHCRVTPEMGTLYVLIATGIALTVRSLFGSILQGVSGVSMTAFPILLIIGAYYLIRLQRTFHRPIDVSQSSDSFPPVCSILQRAIQANCALLIMVAYSVVSLALLIGLHAYYQHTSLVTLAGPVQIRDKNSIEIYEYVMSHSQSQDTILSVSYGGGVNFAAYRISPAFLTQYNLLMPDAKLLHRDLEHFLQNPPRLVVAEDLPRLGTAYGSFPLTGLHVVGCRFPDLVWSNTEPACPPDTPFPVVEYILANYQQSAKVGGKVIYTPR